MTEPKTRETVMQLMQKELQYSKERYEEKFHSLHEAESVIREELEELEEKLRTSRTHFEALHAGCRTDNTPMAKSRATVMLYCAVDAAEEAIQLAAMCSKLMEMDG